MFARQSKRFHLRRCACINTHAMSGVLIALVAFAAVAIVLVGLSLGLARSAAHSDQVEHRALRKNRRTEVGGGY
jgi:hypothetical protein